jgi:hypothetical protein
MRWGWWAAAAAAAGLGVRVARGRRVLHPDGRSFTAQVELWGLSGYADADLLVRRGRFPALARISKGGGTPGGRADIRGVAIRVDGRDLLYSTAGTGRFTRRLPAPRRGFDATYGSITSYRTARRGDGPLYLSVVPEPGSAPLGRALPDVTAAAATGRARLLLLVHDRHGTRPFGRLTLLSPLPPAEDAALAFDPVRHTAPGLHPSGLIHASRAWAYRLGQRARRADPDHQPGAPTHDDTAPARAATHR